MSPLNITQPLGIWSTRWLLFQVMSNIPKMGQLPTPGECPDNLALCHVYTVYTSLYPGYTIVWLGDIGGRFLKGFTWSEISTLRKRFWSIVSDCKWIDLILTKLNSSQRFRIYYWTLCIYYLALCGLNSGYGRESKWLCPEEYQYSKTFEHFSWKTYYILLFKGSLT